MRNIKDNKMSNEILYSCDIEDKHYQTLDWFLMLCKPGLSEEEATRKLREKANEMGIAYVFIPSIMEVRAKGKIYGRPCPRCIIVSFKSGIDTEKVEINKFGRWIGKVGDAQKAVLFSNKLLKITNRVEHKSNVNPILNKIANSGNKIQNFELNKSSIIREGFLNGYNGRVVDINKKSISLFMDSVFRDRNVLFIKKQVASKSSTNTK